jgi:hypothetical protein
MYQNHIFLYETGCVLNEKMMPDVAAMVPELEADKKNIKNGKSHLNMYQNHMFLDEPGRPEREDDDRRRCDGPGLRTKQTISNICVSTKQMWWYLVITYSL